MIKNLLLRRLVFLIPLLLGITLLSYALMLLAPGDPTAMLLDPKVKPADLIRIKENLGLNKSIMVQYFIWLKHLVQGDFGYSYINGRPVLGLILERIPATLMLMSCSMLITLLCTIPLGILAALRRDTWVDNVITVFTFVGMSIPTFWLSLLMILYFSLNLGLLPSSGMIDPVRASSGFWSQSWDVAAHMVLPLLVMTIGSLAGLTKYMKMGMLSILGQDYILTARAMGFSNRVVSWKYAAKNAALPVITLMGMSLPNLVSGSFIIEYIFAWPGMGRLGVDSVFMRDFPVIMGIILISSLMIILGNLLSDIAYAVLDPRVSYAKRS